MKIENVQSGTNTSDPIWASNVELLPPEECLPIIGSCQVSSILQTLDGSTHDPHNLQNMDIILFNGTEYKPLEATSLNYVILKDTTQQPTDFSKPHNIPQNLADNVPEKSNTPEKSHNDFEDMLYFVCNMCPFLSTKDTKITEHIESAHKNKAGSSNSRMQLNNFKCPACTNIFHHRSSLKFHLIYDHYVSGDEIETILQAVLYYSNKENSSENKKNEEETTREEAENLKLTKAISPLIEVSDSSETDKEPELAKFSKFIPRLTPSKMMLEHDSSSNCSNSNSTEYFEIHSPGDRPPSVLESTPKKPKIIQQNIIKYPTTPKQLILPSIVPSLEWEPAKSLESHNQMSSPQKGTTAPSKTFSQVLVTNSVTLAPPKTSQSSPPKNLTLISISSSQSSNSQITSLQPQNLLSSSASVPIRNSTTTPVPSTKKVALPQVDITPKNGERLFADNRKNTGNPRTNSEVLAKFALFGPGKKCIYNTCKVRMRDVTKLNYHIGCHTPDGFECMECQEKFSLWRPLTSHLWRFHKIDMELFACDKCDYKTFSWSKLNNVHKLTHGDAKNFQCDICQKYFKNAKQVHNHKEIHKEKPAKPGIKCEKCQKMFNDKRSIKVHNDTVHRKLKPFLCSYCGYKGPTRASLKMHIRSHTGEKPFTCDECNYSSSDHNSLRRHKLRHSGQKPYKCAYCSYACIQSSTYKAHLKTKHPGLEKDLMFNCHLCQFRTINKDMYNSHLVTVHHQDSVQPMTDGTFKIVDSS